VARELERCRARSTPGSAGCDAPAAADAGMGGTREMGGKEKGGLGPRFEVEQGRQKRLHVFHGWELMELGVTSGGRNTAHTRAVKTARSRGALENVDVPKSDGRKEHRGHFGCGRQSQSKSNRKTGGRTTASLGLCTRSKQRKAEFIWNHGANSIHEVYLPEARSGDPGGFFLMGADRGKDRKKERYSGK